jgi:NAD(P)-dependent dehydrogenase (short-subunit alcohol dehydrogenase family)
MDDFTRFRSHCLAILLLVASTAAPLVAQTQSSGPPAVLVTGANSGIGRSVAETLASRGYFVYAGARRAEDIAALSAIPNVQGIRLDVTVQSEIDAAVETIRSGGRELHGVVNNAGIAVIGALVDMQEQELVRLFDVNVYGPWRVTRAFAPMLIQHGGRVVTISSISGILSGAGLGAYSMSKHAIEAFGDALAAELQPLGVGVSLVEPGNYRSDIARNALAHAENQQARERLGAMAVARDTLPEPAAVAEAVAHALFDASPKMRYLVVPVAREAEITIRKQIEELAQLNQAHAFSYDREALLRMLDEALARWK